MKTKFLTNSNSKIKKTNKINNTNIYEFNLPAYKTATGKIVCPFAKECVKFCYANKGSYLWTPTKNKYNNNYLATKKDNFINLIQDEINRKRKITHIRIHSSGDFYSPKYLNKWVQIAKNNPTIILYAYTKSIPLIKNINLPNNFKIIFSTGSKVDFLINTKTDRHAKIFNNEKELLKSGYVNASNNDLLAITTNKKVGLIYH
tara:strand:+ start:71 stop:679 length:609 start_codon:yes stop_codon:yes gene_type:complete